MAKKPEMHENSMYDTTGDNQVSNAVSVWLVSVLSSPTVSRQLSGPVKPSDIVCLDHKSLFLLAVVYRAQC